MPTGATRTLRGRGAAPLGALALLATSHCTLNHGLQCGTNQVLQEDGLCRCVEGASVVNNQCIATTVVAPPPDAGPGTLCDPAAKPCSDLRYPSCQTARNGDMYCTSTGCTSAADCPEGYQCSTETTPSHCRRPFVGQGAACSDNAQCSGFDASGCATLLKSCAVVDCGENTCDPSYTCFDASSLLAGAPKLCVPTSVIPK